MHSHSEERMCTTSELSSRSWKIDSMTTFLPTRSWKAKKWVGECENWTRGNRTTNRKQARWKYFEVIIKLQGYRVLGFIFPNLVPIGFLNMRADRRTAKWRAHNVFFVCILANMQKCIKITETYAGWFRRTYFKHFNFETSDPSTILGILHLCTVYPAVTESKDVLFVIDNTEW